MDNTFELDASCSSYLGGGRSENEDNFYFDGRILAKSNKGMNKLISSRTTVDHPVAYAVFDGIGGALYGEEASYTTAKIFEDGVRTLDKLVVEEKKLLANICSRASESIKSFAKHKQISHIGTTLVSLLFNEEEVYVCNVGDSKAFLIRDGNLLKISKDHTDEEFLRSMGVNKKPSLLQYIGISSEEGGLDPYISKGKIKKGDVYIICSDGITDCMNFQSLYMLAKEGKSSGDIVSNVLQYVKQADGQDNATIIAILVS
ncbi:MAG: serine/threonine-protein phosphatase [Clostridiales bacterium]|nr:serine/threonine-protein phosphatase [Clostridiales bacterium]